jgi:phosphohistidine swiveling domain-containing protein
MSGLGRRERKRQQTMNHLADTAWQLFETHGFETVTMETIAETADVAKGTLYNYFPVKEALLRHHLHRELADRMPKILAVLEGALPGAAIAPRVADRKRQFEKWQLEEAPDVILEQPDGSMSEQVNGDKVRPADGDCFTGVPVGSGFATGKARLLTSPQQGERLARGEILVVPSTDPAWTPLFLKAGGLVMETGGYLSHGAIVAREFGIPAVVNLPGILRQLDDGDQLAVDGGEGTVQRLQKKQTRIA